ncbi:hypothetical protein [Amycolatopsis taiwanensis]|uniref:hypothetical protein n=1 Tax=Amycolatopsis taiwanensis TaxID=342230 RepID=UPI0004881B57|nr:hypothetical protein [Amycolatopsis taiwanensis]
MAVEMLILGAGIGCAIQLLVLVMQNSAEPRFLGVASAAAMFFRSMGGALGTALFSTILARSMVDQLQQTPALPAPADMIAQLALADGTVLPQPIQQVVSHAFADAIHTVYLWTLPLGAVFLILAVILPTVPLWTVEFLRKVKQEHAAHSATE